MLDHIGRHIDYLRISVTDKCNLRCIYCMPEEGIPSKDHHDILRFEEILQIVRVGVALGVQKVRLTGGEPLVRKGLVDFVGELAAIPGLRQIALTTNGTLLAPVADQLRRNGLGRVNISLDTLRDSLYQRVTRRGNIQAVWAGVEAALEAGLQPVKLNVVAIRGVNDDEILEFAELTIRRPLHVRFIELMPIGESDSWWSQGYISAFDLKTTIERGISPLAPVEEEMGFGPAVNFALPSAQGTIGFISAISNHFCNRCNRVRLTADGKLRPCLQDSGEIDLRPGLASEDPERNLAELWIQALQLKPVQHRMAGSSWGNQCRLMSDIGG